MELQQQFEAAQERIHTLTERPDNNTLLALYGLFKQATEGDCNEPAPSLFAMARFAKHSAWQDLSGRDCESCMKEYVELVDRLVA